MQLLHHKIGPLYISNISLHQLRDNVKWTMFKLDFEFLFFEFPLVLHFFYIFGIEITSNQIAIGAQSMLCLIKAL